MSTARLRYAKSNITGTFNLSQSHSIFSRLLGTAPVSAKGTLSNTTSPSLIGSSSNQAKLSLYHSDFII